jgi:hypothetical protein
MYERRNEVARLFRRLKGFRRIFSCFDKVIPMFIGFINFALIVETLRECEHASRHCTQRHMLFAPPCFPYA